MDVREKLVELLSEKCMETCKQRKGYVCSVEECKCSKEKCCGFYADHLISNGVTVQEWISVDDRLPTIYDADDDNCVLAIHKATNKRYYHWRSVADNPFDFTYWTRTPQPPKGE